VVSKLLFIQGGQPIYQYRQVLKLLKEMIQELEDYDKKPHLLDNINRYISSIKRRIRYCQTWAENWTQINLFDQKEEVLQEILKYILERIMACLDTENKAERTIMTYCLKIETFLKIHQTRKQSIENNFILEITE
jgi:superfamily I DNA/RNA helicase